MKKYIISKDKIKMTSWGGLIEVMYTTYEETEIPDNIKDLRKRLDLLESSKTLEEIKETFFFTKKERNYLNSPLLDQIWTSIFHPEPLDVSIYRKMLHSTEFYLQRNFHVRYTWFNGACRDGNKDVVELLLKYKVPIPSEALTEAIEHENKDVIELLLKHGEIPTVVNLSSLCGRGSIELVELLLKHGGVDVTGYNGMPLSNACIHGHRNVAELLLKYGAKLDNVGEILENVLGHGHTDMMEFLLENGISANNHRNMWGVPLIVSSAFFGLLEMTELLLKHGADCTVENNRAIKAAYRQGHVEVVDLLVRHGAVLPIE